MEDLLGQIDDYVNMNPSSTADITAEIMELINRYDPSLERAEGAKKGNLSLVDPGFDTRQIHLKLRDIFKQDLKIPRLRNVADALSRITKIPLPKAVRNNKEALFQYFQNHWDYFGPLLTSDPEKFLVGK